MCLFPKTAHAAGAAFQMQPSLNVPSACPLPQALNSTALADLRREFDDFRRRFE